MIFLEESGATTQRTRNYARAPRGQRVKEATPQGHWQILTMLAALTSQGLQAPMTIAEPTDGDIFLAYLEQVLCPQLRPGQVVIMDNLSAHKVAGVRQPDRLRRVPQLIPDVGMNCRNGQSRRGPLQLIHGLPHPKPANVWGTRRGRLPAGMLNLRRQLENYAVI